MSDPTADAFEAGVKATRQALGRWRRAPLPVLGSWFAGSLAIATVLLACVVIVGAISPGTGDYDITSPPFQTGGVGAVVFILHRNLLVLALHSLACVAGFIAGSSLPRVASGLTGLQKLVHEHGARLAIAFVGLATLFSLATQALSLGISCARAAELLDTSPALLLIALLPHAVPELCALFLPLAAWLLAARRQAWDELLAASLVSTVIALPVLVLSACWEVYVAPHLVVLVVGRS